MADEAKRKKRKRIWFIVLGLLLLPVVLFPKTTYYRINAAIDLVRFAGKSKEPKKHDYSGTSMENLRALHQAVSLYYESEGIYPDANGWMDAAKGYVKTADLKKGEEMKKFVNPRIPEGEGVFGYAFNAALSMGYREDVADPASTALIFESKDTKWNANGDPATLQPDPELDGGNNAVTVEGNAVPLKQLLKQ